MPSWKPREELQGAPTTWRRTRSASASSACGGSTSSAPMTGPTCTSEPGDPRSSGEGAALQQDQAVQLLSSTVCKL